MKAIYRLCFAVGCSYLLLAVAVAGSFFLHFRPMWVTSDVLTRVPAFLKDPATPTEKLRQTALDGHQLILSGFQSLDAAIVLILIISMGAGALLLFVGAKIRAASNVPGENAL